MASRKHRIGAPVTSGPIFVPKDNPIARYVALQKRLHDAGLFEGVDLEILQGCAKPFGKRGRLPRPGANLVYDRHYETLAGKGLLRWVQVSPIFASLQTDHYVLTPAGRKLLSGKDES